MKNYAQKDVSDIPPDYADPPDLVLHSFMGEYFTFFGWGEPAYEAERPRSSG